MIIQNYEDIDNIRTIIIKVRKQAERLKSRERRPEFDRLDGR